MFQEIGQSKMGQRKLHFGKSAKKGGKYATPLADIPVVARMAHFIDSCVQVQPEYHIISLRIEKKKKPTAED